jgi:predicted dinucleotide-binding enzyme
MKIGVLGTGQMATVLGEQWVAQGHQVFVGGRDLDKAAALGERLGARAGSLREAAQFGDVLLMGVHWAGIEDTADAIADAAHGKEAVAQLIREIGAEPVDLGPLYHSRDLEGMATVIITLLFGGLAPRTVFNLVTA